MQLLKEGAVDRWLAEFPIVDQFSNQEESEINKDPSYVFDAQDFVETQVFGVHFPPDLSLHRLEKVNNFPNNVNFIIESSAPASNENEDEDNESSPGLKESKAKSKSPTATSNKKKGGKTVKGKPKGPGAKKKEKEQEWNLEMMDDIPNSRLVFGETKQNNRG